MSSQGMARRIMAISLLYSFIRVSKLSVVNAGWALRV
jgi:hypothetical protein